MTELKSDDANGTTVELVLLMHQGRSVSDDNWQEIDAAHIQIWEQAKSLLASWEAETPKSRVRVDIDWKPVLVRLRQRYRAMSRLYDASTSADERNAIRFPRRPIRVLCKATVKLPQSSERAAEHEATHCAESFLHDLFLILNLTAPGSCSFDGAKLRLRRRLEPWYMGAELRLSDFYVDVAYMRGAWNQWPSPKMLPLTVVIDWYKAVRSGISQIPMMNRAEKVLFALLHICQTEAPLNAIIWLFYGLETLFDTRPGENRRTLLGRISLLLTPTAKQREHLRAGLNRLYDIRSSFVHGGRDVVHPMHNEAIDKRVDESFRELADSAEFGFAVLVVCLQHLIERGCAELNFREVVDGVSLGAETNGNISLQVAPENLPAMPVTTRSL